MLELVVSRLEFKKEDGRFSFSSNLVLLLKLSAHFDWQQMPYMYSIARTRMDWYLEPIRMEHRVV